MSNIIEIGNDDLEKVKEINELIDQTFPELLHTNIELRLNKYHRSSYPKIKIFIIEDHKKPVSFAQVIYKLWNNQLVVDLDLLGSQYSVRRNGFAEAIFQHCRNDLIVEKEAFGINAVGLMTFIDPNYEPIVRFHEKNNGQLRRDATNEFSEIVVWYPSIVEYGNIKTIELIEQMKDFAVIIGLFI
jgi:hypothetical protein